MKRDMDTLEDIEARKRVVLGLECVGLGDAPEKLMSAMNERVLRIEHYIDRSSEAWKEYTVALELFLAKQRELSEGRASNDRS